MNAASTFDLGPLTWVKAEIDLALQRAEEALGQRETVADATQIKFCRTHVHQVHGALSIVGLDGVTQVTESLDALLAGLEENRLTADLSTIGVLRQAISELRRYLDDLMVGEPNQPLRLLPVYRALADARGLQGVHEADLFYPDLSQRPTKRTDVFVRVAPEQKQSALRSNRVRFQKGLLTWLKNPVEAEAGRSAMLDALENIEALQETQSARTFWWIAQAFVEALGDPGVASSMTARQLCSRVDAQIRRLLDGSNNVAERVMREALYHIAHAPAALDPLVEEIQTAFGLPALMPASAAGIPDVLPQDGLLRKLRETLVVAEELWNKFCTGGAGSLTGFADNARHGAQLTEEIGQTDLKRLGQGLGAVAAWLQEDTTRFNDTVAMEVATTILLMQNAQESFKRLGTDFAQQVDLMVERLYACIAGKPAPADEGIPLLDEMTRRAQEKLLIGQVGREIQNNLAQVEQALDGFFRDPSKAHDLTQLDAPLKQISGALAMLGHFPAVNSLKDCSARIQQFAQPGYLPVNDDFEAVASQLSILGFFVDALQSGETDFDAFVRHMKGDKPDESDDSEDLFVPSVEAQLAQQAHDTHVLAEALRDAPEDSRLQNEIKQNLQAIQQDADLVANRELVETAKAALEALQSGSSVDEALSALKPQVAEAPTPSAQTLQLADSAHDVIDAELLDIFLEEAVEVLATIEEQNGVLVSDLHNIEALTTIRRSTHTLKGSGRMVGLTDLGEAAWEVEQTLNLWLRQEQAVNDELLGMVSDERALFSVWINFLETGVGQAPDPSSLINKARRLRGVETAAEAMLSSPATVAVLEEPAPAIQVSLPEEKSPEVVDLAALELPDFDMPSFDEPESHVQIDIAEPLLAEPDMSLQVIDADDDLRSTGENDEILQIAAGSPTLYDIFREEARGHLHTLVDSYAVLDAHPGEQTTFEMTRAAHTLGGIAATVGLMPLNRLAIALEHALLRRDGSAHPESIEGLETVRQAIITLEGMFDALADQIAPEDQPRLIVALEDIFHTPHVEEAGQKAPDSIPPAVQAESLESSSPGEVGLIEIPAASLLKDELDEQLLPIFLEEAVDQLRDLTVQCRNWRNDPASDVAPHAIARILHTFKGNARMAGAMNLGEVTHLLETRIENAQRGGSVGPVFIDDVEANCDVLAAAVERLRAGPQSVVEESVPDGETEAGSSIALPMADEPEIEAGEQTATLRVRADLVDRLVNEAGELSIARTRIEGEMRSLKGSLLELTENVIRLRRQLREIEIQAEGQIQARVAQTPEGQTEFDPLELDRFTRFQELTRFMAESVNDVATVQQNLLKNLDDANAAILAQSRLNRGLQQDLMGVRMLPFASQADRLYRIVRQTAKDVGKRANLDIVGSHVEIDRSVLDKMLGPVEHMLRNAVTHGIETREQRLAANKTEVGEITISLAQEGNEIILSMHDDGKGLDQKRIRARAESLGLLAVGQEISEAALFDFIFQPGFSTATELTQVSGRGVGMDVVKTEVSALGGRIEIRSQAGQGTTFRLYLPLTLAVTQTVFVRAGNQLYAVPSTMVEQVLEMKEKALNVLREKGEAEWQGNHYPLHFLPHLLGDMEAVPEVHRQYWILLLRSGSQRVAVLVDELKGNQEVVVKNIGAQLARLAGVAGATVLGDGKVLLILNPVALANRQNAPALRAAAPVPTVVSAPHLPTIMVVDDSLTVRKITSRLLTREGYQVILAKDGVDALEQLTDIMPDVILSDIEMPRMDGFDFVRNVRADDHLKSLPIIMITSRTADKHRNYAFELGANHYLGKPYDEEELLALVARYTKGKS